MVEGAASGAMLCERGAEAVADARVSGCSLAVCAEDVTLSEAGRGEAGADGELGLVATWISAERAASVLDPVLGAGDSAAGSATKDPASVDEDMSAVEVVGTKEGPP